MMKRLILASILLVLTLHASSQYKPVILGLRGGFNLGWMKSGEDLYENKGMTPGLSWGFVSEFYFMENYAVQTGFNIQYLKGRLEYPYRRMIDADSSAIGYLNRKYKINYLQIPVTIKMKANLSEKFNFFGKVGIGTAFRLDAKAEDVFTYGDGEKIEENNNIKEDIALMRAPLILGLGAEYIIKGSTAVIMEFTFDNGFVDVLKGKNPAMPEENEQANLSFMEFGIGIVF